MTTLRRSAGTVALTALAGVVAAGCGTAPPPSATARPSIADGTSPSQPDTSPGADGPDAPADPERILELLTALEDVAFENGGIRAAGTGGYEASVDLVVEELRAMGLDVETPEVAFTSFRDADGGSRVGARTFVGPDEVRALIYSPRGEVSGAVAVLQGSGCDADDFAGIAEGSIAVTLEGGCLRRDQALNAGDAGMAALVVGYPALGPGEIFRPTLIDPAGLDVPVVSVTEDAVEALLAAESEPATVTAATEMSPGTFRNVIAELGDGSRTIMVGAHLDSVLDGPGINDNGSGVAAVLEIARAAVTGGVPPGWSLRVGLWGAEELGTIGSRAYASGAAVDDLEAYLNLDMAGSVNGATLVYDEPGAAPGSAAITAAYEAWLSERGEPFEGVDLGGSSDHFGFVVAGVPTGGLFAGAAASGSAANPSTNPSGPAPDPCYHIGCDDVSNVDVDRVALFADATLAVVRELMADR